MSEECTGDTGSCQPPSDPQRLDLIQDIDEMNQKAMMELRRLREDLMEESQRMRSRIEDIWEFLTKADGNNKVPFIRSESKESKESEETLDTDSSVSIKEVAGLPTERELSNVPDLPREAAAAREVAARPSSPRRKISTGSGIGGSGARLPTLENLDAMVTDEMFMRNGVVDKNDKRLTWDAGMKNEWPAGQDLVLNERRSWTADDRRQSVNSRASNRSNSPKRKISLGNIWDASRCPVVERTSRHSNTSAQILQNVPDMGSGQRSPTSRSRRPSINAPTTAYVPPTGVPGEIFGSSIVPIDPELMPSPRGRSKSKENFPNRRSVDSRQSDEQYSSASRRSSVDSSQYRSSRRVISNETTSRRSGRRKSSLDALRAEHDAMLVHTLSGSRVLPKAMQDVDQDVGLDWTDVVVSSLYSAPRALLCIFGVLRNETSSVTMCHGTCVLMLLAACLVYNTWAAVTETNLFYFHMSTACYSLGALIALLSVRVRGIDRLLGPDQRPLELYAEKMEFLDHWRSVSVNEFIIVASLWTLMVLSRILACTAVACPDTLGGQSAGWPLSLASFLFVTGVLAVLAYTQLHVCCGLELGIDNFCVRFFEKKDLDKGISDWNMLQATLRRSAHTIEGCYLASGTCVAATLLLTGVASLQLASPDRQQYSCMALWYGWGIPPVVMVLYTIFRAAAITEKCSRAPSLVNSWTFDCHNMDYGRKYAVEYMIYSAAGFYVQGVRLSGFMATKFAYTLGALIFVLAARYISDPDGQGA